MKRILSLIFSILALVSISKAQTADVTITLNEQFFDALLDAVFTNLKQPSFPLSMRELPGDGETGRRGDGETGRQGDKETRRQGDTETGRLGSFEIRNSNFELPEIQNPKSKIQNPKSKIQNPNNCDESIRLHREIDGVRTAVHFRDGKIYAPLAFSGSYNPPLIGCIDFEGWAESTIELEFDPKTQTFIGRATVLEVQLSGTGGIGSSLIAKLVQSSIDSKINPIKIIDMEKISFIVPVQNSGSLRMQATGIRHDIGNGVLNVHISYQFLKA